METTEVSPDEGKRTKKYRFIVQLVAGPVCVWSGSSLGRISSFPRHRARFRLYERFVHGVNTGRGT